MNRRGFLGSLLGLAAAPVLAGLPVPTGALFTGKLGVFEGVRFIETSYDVRGDWRRPDGEKEIR